MPGDSSPLESILNNPKMMEQIMQLANSLGQDTPAQQDAAPKEAATGETPQQGFPGSIMDLLAQTGIDKNQQALLSALKPYLAQVKLQKLQRAMQAAKMADLASSLLQNGGLHLTGG